MTEPAALEKKQQRSFTGDKLDWMTALSADPRLDPRAFEVGFCIAQHVNQTSGIAILSDDTISDKTAIPKRWITRARAELREAGWIDWKRTKTANIYWTRGEKMNYVLEHQDLLRECRKERREKLRKRRVVTPPVAHLKSRDQPHMANADAPPVANRETPPVADIHLSNYTLIDTPSNKRVVDESDWLVDDDGKSLRS